MLRSLFSFVSFTSVYNNEKIPFFLYSNATFCKNTKKRDYRKKDTGVSECFIERYCLLFQKISPTVPLQYLHLLDCNLVELYQAFALGHSIVDKDGIDILHVREADEFVDGGIVADVAFQFCLVSNCGEFAIIKIGIVNTLPHAKEFHRVSIAKPIGHKEIAIFGFQHICNADVILTVYIRDCYLRVLDCYLCQESWGQVFDSIKQKGSSQAKRASSSTQKGLFVYLFHNEYTLVTMFATGKVTTER